MPSIPSSSRSCACASCKIKVCDGEGGRVARGGSRVDERPARHGGSVIGDGMRGCPRVQGGFEDGRGKEREWR